MYYIILYYIILFCITYYIRLFFIYIITYHNLLFIVKYNMMFIKNYLYELPDDIQGIIYKKVFDRCIAHIKEDLNIKYLNRLYIAIHNPSNTCVYSIAPKGMFRDYNDHKNECDPEYKYERIALIEGFRNNNMKSMVYLDRAHLTEDISQSQYDTISYYIYPLFISSKRLKKYLTIRFNLIKYYDKRLIRNITVVEDRVDIVFTSSLKCNADIYYNILVGYNVIYNSLSNIIFSEDNTEIFRKLVELFRWVEYNNVLHGYNICDNKIIPMLEKT